MGPARGPIRHYHFDLLHDLILVLHTVKWEHGCVFEGYHAVRWAIQWLLVDKRGDRSHHCPYHHPEAQGVWLTSMVPPTSSKGSWLTSSHRSSLSMLRCILNSCCRTSPSLTALAWPADFESLSRRKPGQSRGFQAKPGWNITTPPLPPYFAFF